MSEPIHGTKMLYTPDTRPPSNKSDQRGSRPNNRDSSYDPTSVLDVLRLQRQQEKRKVPVGIAGKWKWNTVAPPGTHGNFEVTGNIKPSVKDGFNASNKTDRVKKMQEVYMQQQRLDEHGAPLHLGSGGGLVAEAGGLAQQQSSPKVTLSPIRARPVPSSPYAPPRTPVVKDKDLTDEDYAAVSKYFGKGRSSPQPQRQTHTLLSYAPSRQTEMELDVSPVRAYRSAVPSYPYVDPMHHQSTPHQHQPALLAPMGTTTTISSPTKSALTTLRAGDGGGGSPGGYGGGRALAFSRGVDGDDADMSLCAPPSPEGLLNWSAALNADLIDSMF
jgi:hypothetical protein